MISTISTSASAKCINLAIIFLLPKLTNIHLNSMKYLTHLNPPWVQYNYSYNLSVCHDQLVSSSTGSEPMWCCEWQSMVTNIFSFWNQAEFNQISRNSSKYKKSNDTFEFRACYRVSWNPSFYAYRALNFDKIVPLTPFELIMYWYW